MNKPRIDVLPIEQSGLKPDIKNANKGTQRGRGLLEKSLRKLGAGRSILTDRDGNVIAGNKTLEGAAEIGLPVRIIETDGRELVVVKRTDLDLYSESDKRGRELAYVDNKVAELDLAWDVDQIAADMSAGVELGEWGFDAELGAPEAPPAQAGINVQNQYGVIVICSDEQEQEETYNTLTGLGYKTRVVTV